MILLHRISFVFAIREMKKGNVGMAVSMTFKKLRFLLGQSVDLGLTGLDGVVHPSLEVRTSTSFLLKIIYLPVEVSQLLCDCRKAQRSWKITSTLLEPQWRAYSTDMER